MKNLKAVAKTPSVISLLVLSTVWAFTGVPAAHAQVVQEPTPGVPNVDLATDTDLEAQKHFLTFLGSFIPESTTSAKAYYAAIDPGTSKLNFTAWLVNAGFIGQASDWNPTGPQKIACDLPGCDLPSHTNGALTYGPSIINTDSHAIVLNAADLGFVRNQFVRCKPSCSARNPIIYTYLENYPVAPFAQTSHFPVESGYPTEAEAAAAMKSALNRPAGLCPSTGVAPGGGACNPGANLQRIADVAFEWAPPASNLLSTQRFGQLYAYIVDQKDPTIETLTFPADAVAGANSRVHFSQDPIKGFPPIDMKTGATITLTTNDFFAPELDGRGFKYMPGVCLICHGGKPTNLTSTGLYPRSGNINGFRFLPLDIRNLMFTSDLGPDQPATNGSKAFTDRVNQEAQIKEYNRAVLLTVDQSSESDGTGAVRPPHVATVIKGWYAPNFTSKTQNADFVPPGWTGFENLYRSTVAPSCRSCHFNREISLDFGTIQNFSQDSDILQLAALPSCNTNQPDPHGEFMPAAHLTYQRYWQANGAHQTLFFGQAGGNPTASTALDLFHTADQLVENFGFGSVADYCASNP
jgi:hypothetical protein